MGHIRELVGYEIDLCNMLAKYIGVKAQLTPISPHTRGPHPPLRERAVALLASEPKCARPNSRQESGLRLPLQVSFH